MDSNGDSTLKELVENYQKLVQAAQAAYEHSIVSDKRVFDLEEVAKLHHERIEEQRVRSAELDARVDKLVMAIGSLIQEMHEDRAARGK